MSEELPEIGRRVYWVYLHGDEGDREGLTRIRSAHMNSGMVESHLFDPKGSGKLLFKVEGLDCTIRDLKPDYTPGKAFDRAWIENSRKRNRCGMLVEEWTDMTIFTPNTREVTYYDSALDALRELRRTCPELSGELTEATDDPLEVPE